MMIITIIIIIAISRGFPTEDKKRKTEPRHAEETCRPHLAEESRLPGSFARTLAPVTLTARRRARAN